MPLQDLAIELIDTIVFEVERPSDLLAFSLTCRAISQRIIPDQLPFRDVEESINNLHIWDSLLEHPDLAARIRSIHL
ncbi:hypothetical protein M422DRAFT_178479, partial [Sphaerobolus stellatus SS14]